jgi:hypothetical protein
VADLAAGAAEQRWSAAGGHRIHHRVAIGSSNRPYVPVAFHCWAAACGVPGHRTCSATSAAARAPSVRSPSELLRASAVPTGAGGADGHQIRSHCGFPVAPPTARSRPRRRWCAQRRPVPESPLHWRMARSNRSNRRACSVAEITPSAPGSFFTLAQRAGCPQRLIGHIGCSAVAFAAAPTGSECQRLKCPKRSGNPSEPDENRRNRLPPLSFRGTRIADLQSHSDQPTGVI